jgi:hypothetical protein
MILTMFLALVATTLLPIVFMAALAASADAHPKSLGATLKELGRPIAAGAERVWARIR